MFYAILLGDSDVLSRKTKREIDRQTNFKILQYNNGDFIMNIQHIPSKSSLIKTFVAVISLAVISGCTRIPTGSVGVEQHFDGQIESISINPGIYVSPAP